MVTTIGLVCANCDNNFKKSKSEYDRCLTRNTKNHFCSRECHVEYKRAKTIELTCHGCGSRFKRTLTQHRKSLKANSSKFYCTFKCRSKGVVTLTCGMCEESFERKRKQHENNIRHEVKNEFCSKNCADKFQSKGSIELICHCCKKTFDRTVRNHNTRLRKGVKNYFCSSTCAGIDVKESNVSNLERYIQGKLDISYVELEIRYNDRKEVYPLELDILFPDISLAIEINGIHHYKPIYGIKTLKAKVANDEKKKKLSKEKGIEIIVIDNLQKFTETFGNKIFKQIQEILYKEGVYPSEVQDSNE